MRTKKIGEYYYPQRRFLLFWFIPVWWVNLTYEFGDDDLLGLPSTEYKFTTKAECDRFITIN